LVAVPDIPRAQSSPPARYLSANRNKYFFRISDPQSPIRARASPRIWDTSQHMNATLGSLKICISNRSDQDRVFSRRFGVIWGALWGRFRVEMALVYLDQNHCHNHHNQLPCMHLTRDLQRSDAPKYLFINAIPSLIAKNHAPPQLGVFQ